ncbi:hypothetical protein FQN49_008455 [Arthroderma sp. PD_2]|nr:hypothetical protein FQN49_008455 [Arthroderma sp. PD_2]
MPPQPSYATHSSQQQAQQQQPPPPSVPGYGVAPPQQNPYLQSPAAATSDVPTKTEEYASYRGPSAYPTAFQPSSSHPAPPSHSHLYRTPSIPTRPSASDIPTSIDPAASPSASAYSRASFTLPGAMDSKQQQPQQQQLDQRNTYPGPAPARRESAYYDQAQAQAQAAHQRRASIQQQAPPQQPQSQQPYYPNTAATGQSSYQGAPPMSTWGATHGQAI